MIRSELEHALIRIATDLRSLEARWALIGGLAVSIRIMPRQTKDVDVMLAVGSDREAEPIVRSLLERGYRHRERGVFQEKGGGRLALVKLLAPNMQEGVIDLLLRVSGIEIEVAEAAEVLEVRPGVWVPVARIGHLIALKILAVADDPNRPDDLGDLQRLWTHAQPADRLHARDAVEMISRRGFEPPGADLLADLAEWERKFPL